MAQAKLNLSSINEYFSIDLRVISALKNGGVYTPTIESNNNLG
jgi:hypothetical protein